MTVYQDFLLATANLLLQDLPLQSLDSSILLVYSYISNNGGWVPIDQNQPLGDGGLLSGFSEQQTADAIRDQQINSVYDIEFSVDVTIKVNICTQLTDGLSLNAAAASMVNLVSNFVTSSINPSRLPMAVTATGAQATNSAKSMTGGYTTQAIRQAISGDLAVINTTKEVDFKGITLLFVRNTYGVDNTWNVYSIYTEPEQPIVVQIKKYTNATYGTLDGTSTKIYVITVSPTTYEVVTGVIIE